MFTILPISGLIAKPLFGGLADKFMLHKMFFIIFQAILTIAFLSINFIPKVSLEEPSAMATFTCNELALLQTCLTMEQLNQEDLQNIKTIDGSCNLSCSIQSLEDVQKLCNSSKFNEICDSIKTIQPDSIEYLNKFKFEAKFHRSYNLSVSIFMY